MSGESVASSYTSSSSSSSGHSSSSRHRSTRFATSSDSDQWTITEGRLAPPRSLAVRFIGYAAGRPYRATGLKKKVRDTSDTSSVRSAGTAGSIFAYEPETRMYWVKDKGSKRKTSGSGGASFSMSGAIPPAFGSAPMPRPVGGMPPNGGFAGSSPAGPGMRPPPLDPRQGVRMGFAPPSMQAHVRPPMPPPAGAPPVPPAGFRGPPMPATV
ncbi:hypothetical protein HJFPF1_09140 [Paramyrothecium foliicola]|nr:hypothetical protein HJFPF1_09140 [Paramyrothecium foliicola]